MPISTNAVADGSFPAFNGCSNIKQFNFTKGTGEGSGYTTGSYFNTPWYYSRGSEIVVIIEEGVTKINEMTFYGCTGLRLLKLPSTLTTIEKDAFTNCVADLIKVIYNGNASEWDNISLDNSRTYLSNVIYNKN